MMVKHLLFACLLLSTLAARGSDLAVGKPMPMIQAKLLDGAGNIQIGPGTGKVAIVNFWASWCAPCRAEMPAMQSYYDKHKSQGLVVLAVNMDDAGDLADMRKVARSFNFPISLKNDTDFKGLGRIWRMPSTFVVDRHGVLQKNGHEGKPTVDLDSLEALVTPLLDKP